MEMLCQNGGILQALNVKTYGSGTETMVLAHGFGETQETWKFIVPVLAYYFKVVVFDLVFSANVDPKLYDPRRYNSSYDGYVDDLICILHHLEVKEAKYLGQSLSAMVGYLAYQKDPQLFSHVILQSGSPRYINDTGYTGGFTKTAIDNTLRDIKNNFTGWAQNFAPMAVGANNSAAVAEFQSSLERMNKETALSVLKTAFNSDYRKALRPVTMPYTIIQSSGDRSVPHFVGHYLKGKLGVNAQLKILNTTGHFPHLTASGLLLKVLKQVLHLH